jgi:hypothetical protein
VGDRLSRRFDSTGSACWEVRVAYVEGRLARRVGLHKRALLLLVCGGFGVAVLLCRGGRLARRFDSTGSTCWEVCVAYVEGRLALKVCLVVLLWARLWVLAASLEDGS